MDAPGDASSFFERHGMRSGAVVYPALLVRLSEAAGPYGYAGTLPSRISGQETILISGQDAISGR